MKITLLLFLALFFSFPVSSQSDKSRSGGGELKSDTGKFQSPEIFQYHNKDSLAEMQTPYYFDGKKFEAPQTAIDTINPKEYFPGSKRYYAKRSLNKDYSYYDSFVKEPDNSAKYYLIIKDPLTKKVTR